MQNNKLMVNFNSKQAVSEPRVHQNLPIFAKNGPKMTI